jgi:glutamate/tyrosine decarboxylase-like PLP-dependent enzyme
MAMQVSPNNQYCDTNVYAEIIRRNINFAQQVASYLNDSPQYELLNPSSAGADSSRLNPIIPLNIVLFRSSANSPYPPSSLTSSADLTKAINNTGKMYVTATKWRGVGAVRLAVSNWRTGKDGDGDLDIVRGVLAEVVRK